MGPLLPCTMLIFLILSIPCCTIFCSLFKICPFTGTQVCVICRKFRPSTHPPHLSNFFPWAVVDVVVGRCPSHCSCSVLLWAIVPLAIFFSPWAVEMLLWAVVPLILVLGVVVGHRPSHHLLSHLWRCCGLSSLLPPVVFTRRCCGPSSLLSLVTFFLISLFTIPISS
jgi:hypothetical protein